MSAVPGLSSKECEAIIVSQSINAMKTHQLTDNSPYQEALDSLSKTCAELISHHHMPPRSIIKLMEETLRNQHHEEIKKIDAQIEHLFKLRKQIPANTSCGEQDLIKLTTKISILEEQKSIPVKDTIREIVYKSLEGAVTAYGVEMPLDFALNLYEYRK